MSTQFTNRQWRLPNNENKDKQSNYSFTDSGTVNISQPAEVGITSSYSFWMNRNSATANTGYFYNVVGTAGYGMFFLNSSKIYLRYGGASYIILSSTELTNAILQINVWQNWTITRKEVSATAQDIKLYVDGVKVVEVLNTTGVGTLGSSVKQVFGAGSIIKMDSFSVFDYVLSLSQITTLQGSSSTGIGNPMSLSPKPVAYYPLGDQDAFNGASYLTPNASLKDFVFDFSSDVINTNSLGISGANSRTISCWFNADSTSNQNIIGFGAASQGNNFTIAIYNSNIFAHTWNTGGVGGDLSGSAVTAGKWHLAVMTYDGTNLKISLDGGTYATTTASLNTTNSIFKIGSSYYTAWNLFSGKISNTKVWNTDLSQAEVTTLYNNGSPIQTLSSIPQNSNLKGWWKLDATATYDSSTTTWSIPDDSTNSNTGTSSGMTQANLVQSDLSFTSGYSPYALDFDGTNDYIDYGNVDALKLGAGDFTWSGWLNPDSWTSSFEALYTCLANNGVWIGIDGTNFVLRIVNGSNIIAYSTLPTVNTWTNICITRVSGACTLYYNGVSVATATSTHNFNVNGSVNLGGYGTYGNFNGKISNLSIWNAGLTSTQVSELYNEGVPSNLNNHSAYSNLVSWWQLGSNSSFNTNWTVLDEKGSNNGTSVNMTEDDIVDGVGSYANGLSSGMGGDEVIGDAPYSTANSLSVNMDVEDRVTDTPS